MIKKYLDIAEAINYFFDKLANQDVINRTIE